MPTTTPELERAAYLISIGRTAKIADDTVEKFKDSMSAVLYGLNCPVSSVEDIMRAINMLVLNVRAGAAGEQTVNLEELGAALPLDLLRYVHAHDLPTPMPEEGER